MDIHLDYGHRDDDDDRPGTDMSDEFPTGEYPALADTGYHMVRMVRMVPMVPAIMNPRRNEYADLPTRDAMKALVGVWHDMNEAGCCDSDGPPFCPESKAYAHGYLAALAAEGY
jgi:hypothetical protein